ncbi:MAG: nicotinate-nucleotide adenylyltransferase [Candidatus Geothermincolia bacterium]
MGGTFDPIHIGHLVTAEEARCQFELDKVVFVPSARPPHKTDTPHSPALDRLRMVELAINGNSFLAVSDIELSREGLSYTVDTLRDLHREYGPGTELFFVTGADAILEILTWKNPEELLAEARFIAASRPGYPLEKLRESLPEQTSEGADALDSVYSMEIPALAISSTDIRDRAAHGRPFRYLVRDSVWEYVQSHGLYSKGEPHGSG